jgi:hypothetical protein
MRKICLLLSAFVFAAQPLAAASVSPLLPGKPAGVRPAQVETLVPIYGGVLFCRSYPSSDDWSGRQFRCHDQYRRLVDE